MSLPKSVYQWSINDVGHWMKENHFEAEVQDFKDHLIDGKALSLLHRSDIKELIKRVGPRVKFRAKLLQLLTSRGMANNLDNKLQRNQGHQGSNDNNINKSSNQQQAYNIVPVYPQSCPPQFVQRVRYAPNSQNVKESNNIINNNNTFPLQHLQPQQQQQRIAYQQQLEPLKANYQTLYPIKNGQQTYLTNGSNQMIMARPMGSEERLENSSPYAGSEGSIITVKPLDFRSLKQPSEKQTLCGSQQYGNHGDTEENPEEEMVDRNSYVEITKFVKGTGFKQEELSDIETEENQTLEDNSGSVEKVDAEISQDKTGENGDIMANTRDNKHNNENIDPHNSDNFTDEEINLNTTTNTIGREGGELSPVADDFTFDTNGSTADGIDDDSFPILDVSVGDNNELRRNFNSSFSNKTSSEHNKLGIEAVTNRLALRERAKIFRHSEKKWHVAVNETAYQLVLKDPKLLVRKKDLRLMAECRVRKTYRFAKGKSRSIALPENRAAAEERKKQKLTKEKIFELKRQINAEGEEISRKMRQCHMNLSLANQQSDATKTIELRQEMQQLNQQQAKLHFTMDELLTKERKLDSGLSKILKTPTMPDTNYTNIENSGNSNNNNIHNCEIMEINDQSSRSSMFVSPQTQSIESQQLTMVPTQHVSYMAAAPQSSLLSPQVSQQVHIDEHGRVVQVTNAENNFSHVNVIDGGNKNNNIQNTG